MEERVVRLGHVLEVELVAQVGRVLREDAVPEEAEDGAVFLLQPQLRLGLEFVEIVEVAHEEDCSPARTSDTVPFPGIFCAGINSASGSTTKSRSWRRGCGTTRPGSATVSSP